MPDFTLEHPEHGKAVTGSPGERALLLSRGYKDITGEADKVENVDSPTDAEPVKDAKSVDKQVADKQSPLEPTPSAAAPKAVKDAK